VGSTEAGLPANKKQPLPPAAWNSGRACSPGPSGGPSRTTRRSPIP